MNLEKRLAEHWPPNDIKVTCEVCGLELFHAMKSPIRGDLGPGYVATHIEMMAKEHDNDTGHQNINVELDVPTRVSRDIDCTVTVND